MADMAVGVVSLGIQVTYGVVTYLHAVKGRKKAIQEALDEAKNLLGVFDTLNRSIVQIASTRTADAAFLRQSLEAAQKQLIELQILLKELGVPVETNAWKGKMKDAYRATVYPLRQGSMDSMRGTVQGLLRNLQLALSVVNLNNQEAQDAKMGDIRRAVVPTVETIVRLEAELNDKTSNLQAAVHDNQDQLEDLNELIADIRGDIVELSDRVEIGFAVVQATTIETLTNSQRAAANSHRANKHLERVAGDTNLILQKLADIQAQLGYGQQGGYSPQQQDMRIMAKLTTSVPPASLAQACSEQGLMTTDFGRGGTRNQICNCCTKRRSTTFFSWTSFYNVRMVSEKPRDISQIAITMSREHQNKVPEATSRFP